MMELSGLLLPLAFLAWGVIVGVDVVSVPQSMLSRPIVVAVVAGLIAALLEAPEHLDRVLASCVFIGVVMELYALDVLPVGAARYPDFGPATVAAVYTSWDLDAWFGGGIGIAVGLATAILGGWAMRRLRRANASAVQTHADLLDGGDPGIIRRLQWGGIGRDVLRSGAVTCVGLALGSIVWIPSLGGSATYHWLTLAAVAGGLAAVLGGALRRAGRTRRVVWFAAGLVGGTALAVIL